MLSDSMNNYILTLNQIHIKGCRVTCSLFKINSSNGVLIVFDMIHLCLDVEYAQGIGT